MRLRWLTLLSLLCWASACRRTDDMLQKHVGSPSPAPEAQEAPAAGAASAPSAIQPYPLGSWRQRPLAELSDTVLWLSHILIRHTGVSESRASFTVTDWSTAVPPALRSPEQALTLAREIAAAASQTGGFEEVARARSEDPITRERGGSLGGATMAQLLPWSQVLDALEALRPGEVSRPVETEFGYHVLLRRAVPPDQQVSGARLVIGHDQAPWIEVVGRRAARRTRQDALLLVTRIQHEAQASPKSFTQLAQEHSDHRDAARGGDFGTWCTHEPNPFPREIEILSQLRVGEVSEPVDTVFGLQILERTANRDRIRYAMGRLLLRFDPSLPEGTPGSKSVVRARAQQLASELQEDPQPFDHLRTELCCAEPIEVIEGREPPDLEQVLAQLQIGQIATQPLEYASVFYLIARRLRLDQLTPKRATRFELSREE